MLGLWRGRQGAVAGGECELFFLTYCFNRKERASFTFPYTVCHVTYVRLHVCFTLPYTLLPSLLLLLFLLLRRMVANGNRSRVFLAFIRRNTLEYTSYTRKPQGIWINLVFSGNLYLQLPMHNVIIPICVCVAVCVSV